MSKRSLPSSADGFSLVELLVSMSVMLAITAATLSLSVSTRGVYEADEARTQLNQKLRSALDIIANDLRQAGERLPGDFPAIEIIDGGAGVPDRIVVRRGLLDVVLPLCADHIGSDPNVFVAATATPPPGCTPLADDDGDGFPDNIGNWRTARLAAGGTLRAYIYDPVSRNGEYFDYTNEDAATLSIRRGDAIGWAHDYLVVNLSRIYILEERTYTLSGTTLQLTIDGTPTTLDIVDSIDDLQALVNLQDGTTQASLGTADLWAQLASIEVSLVGVGRHRDAPLVRELSTAVFPRNVLSQ